MERVKRDHFDKIKLLAETLDEKQQFIDGLYDATMNADSNNLAFIARIDEEIIGAFLMAKDVNLEYYKSHFHI